LHSKNGCRRRHEQNEKDIAQQVFMLKKFYDGKPVVYLD